MVTPDGWEREGQTPVSVSDLRLSICDSSSDHLQMVAGGFERLFGIMVRAVKEMLGSKQRPSKSKAAGKR